MTLFLGDNVQRHSPFLRLMVCIFLIPAFFLINKSLASELYYLGGVAAFYSITLFTIPSLDTLLNKFIPFTLLIDTILISLFIFWGPNHSAPFATLYLLSITSTTLRKNPLQPYLAALMSSLGFLTVIYLLQSPLLPAITQVFIFFISAFITWYISNSVHNSYFQEANQDSLTKIHNRRYFNQTLTRLISSKTNFSLMLMDLDNFKKLNDTQGHHHGDYVLKIIALILKECARGKDIVSRYGGDEFVIILPQTTKEESKKIGENIRNKVLINPKLYSYSHISLSVGIASFPQDAESADDILQKADEALYQAKGMGKNYVFIY